jgi:hypothetical protein
MAQFGNGGKIGEETFSNVFKQFGICDEQVYAGGLNNKTFAHYEETMNKRINHEYGSRIQKDGTLTTSNEFASGTLYSGTSGNLPVLIPIWVAPEIVQLSHVETLLYGILRKRAVNSKYVDWITNTWNSSNAGFRPEGAAAVPYVDTHARGHVILKYAYAYGKVSGQMQLFSR